MFFLVVGNRYRPEGHLLFYSVCHRTFSKGFALDISFSLPSPSTYVQNRMRKRKLSEVSSFSECVCSTNNSTDTMMPHPSSCQRHRQIMQRQRRRSRLLSATFTCLLVLSFSVFTCEGWSSSTSSNNKLSSVSSMVDPSILMMALSDVKMQQQKELSMLLNQNHFPSSQLFASYSKISPKQQRRSLQNVGGVDQKFNQQPSEDGRVLGFDIFSTPAHQSNVDLDTWKSGASFSMNSGLSWNSKQQKSDNNHNLVLQEKEVLPAWFPWLPTKAQIQSLKVTELKEACRQRSLVKIGKKADLQDRLWLWTTEQQEQHQAARISGDFLKKWFEQDQDIPTNPTTPNSLAEWSRSVNSDHFTQKRKEIHRQKRQGRPIQKQVPQKLSSKEYLQKLTKTLQTPSSPYSSNKKVKELYMASKQADQMGERNVAIQLLETLVKVAPNDGRIYRRLSRMYKEQGDIHQARAILQMGIRRQPKNPWLWHGAAQLEQPFRARKCYKKALQLDPTFAHSYHALGTLEHTEGNIAQAMKIFKKGIDFCPTNHRLHHALGDLYRGAKLLEDAERSYHRSLEHGSPINYCFAYSALASVAYERDNVGSARKWLQRSVRLNNGRHAQGWVSLAQLEEAQGNEEAARSVCMAAITQYECGLIESRERYRRKQLGLGSKASGGRHQQSSYPKDNPLDAKNLLLKAVPKYRSGDKFLNVYRNWARVEERYGSYETVDQVYERASIAFPLAYKLTLDWASYHATMYNHDRARSLYVEACNKASSRHAEPYRLYAEFEMLHGKYGQARKILFRGAQVVSKDGGGGLDSSSSRGLVELFHTWAICEWNLGNLPRAEVLFDNALRLTQAGEEGAEMRSFLLYSIAKLEFYREKYLLAQHCIGLCMKENALPGGKSKIWELWADIAIAMRNPILAKECHEHAEISMKEEQEEDELSYFLSIRTSRKLGNKGKGMQKFLVRRDPWQIKLFGVEGTPKALSDFYTKVNFPVKISKEEEELVATVSQNL